MCNSFCTTVHFLIFTLTSGSSILILLISFTLSSFVSFNVLMIFSSFLALEVNKKSGRSSVSGLNLSASLTPKNHNWSSMVKQKGPFFPKISL